MPPAITSVVAPPTDTVEHRRGYRRLQDSTSGCLQRSQRRRLGRGRYSSGALAGAQYSSRSRPGMRESWSSSTGCVARRPAGLMLAGECGSGRRTVDGAHDRGLAAVERLADRDRLPRIGSPGRVHHRWPRSVRTCLQTRGRRPAATRAARGTPRRRGSASARRPGSPRSASRRASGRSTRRSRHVVIFRHGGPPPVLLLLVRVCDSPGIAPTRHASWMRAGTPGAWTFNGIVPTMGSGDHAFGAMMWPHGSRTLAGTEGPYAMVALGYRSPWVVGEGPWPCTAQDMGRPVVRCRWRC